MSEPTVALDEVKPAPTEIVPVPVAYLRITTPESPASFAPEVPGEPPPPVFVP